MTLPPSTPTSSPGAAAEHAEPRPRIRGQLRALLVWFVPLSVSTTLIWGAVPGILLPLQVTAVDPANKVANLALVSSIGAFAALVAQPVAGAVSDRVRSRFGRRSPFILGGALLVGLSLIGLALSPMITLVAISYCGLQFFSNAAWGPATAILPDRVPVPVRGVFSAVIGAGTMVGALIGSIAAASFATRVPLGFVVFGSIVVVVALLFVVVNREESNVGQPRDPFRLVGFLRGFWINPIAHPPFFFAFTGRFLLNLGYVVIFGYQLFILQDYIGLGDAAVKQVPLLSLVSIPTLLLGILVSGPLSDRLRRRKVFIIIAAVVLAIAAAVPLLMPTFSGMLMFSLIAGFGLGMFQAVDNALITEVLPDPDDFAKDMGVINIAASLPQVIAPAISGVVVLSIGYQALFPLTIGLCLIGGVAVFLIRGVR